MFRIILFAITLFCSFQNYAQEHTISNNFHEDTLSNLVKESHSSTTDLPIEIKANVLLHPILQRLKVSGTDLTFEQEFTEEKPDGTHHRFDKKYYISLSSAKFTICPDTTTICFENPSCTIKFSSSSSAQEAFTLLTLLQQQALLNPSFILPSEIAKKHGYTYLVIAPRGTHFEEMVNLLKTSSNQTGTFPNLWCWLTKSSIEDISALLHEGSNRLPLFIYPLTALNSSEFFLTTNLSGTQVLYTDITIDKLQSGTSSNATSLDEFFNNANRSNIVFQKCPDLSYPLKIYISSNEQRQSNKQISPYLKTKFPLPTIVNSIYNIERPVGTAIKWVRGKSLHSSDSLIYALNTYSFSDLIDFLEFEYPALHTLTQYPSTINPKLTILHRAKELDIQLSLNRKDIFTRIALLSHELGTPFGPKSQLRVNSYPFFLSLLEQSGLHKNYGPIIEWYYTHSLPQNKLSMLFYLDRLSYQTFLPRDVVLQALLILESLYGNSSLRNSTPPLPTNLKVYFTGRPANSPHFPLRQLFSSYYWEKQDPLHHAGLSLLTQRTKFETETIRKPSSKWFRHYAKWLNRHIKNISSLLYLEPAERSKYLAKFDGNRIISPLIQFPSNQVIYVIDEEGNIYLGIKDKGTLQTKAFAHSTFLAGGSVISAGKLTVDATGRIQNINNHTGHYRSGKAELEIARKIFERHGASINKKTSDTTD